jgi:hypothetical protein
MNTFYKFKRFCLVFLMGMLIFSLSGCSSRDNVNQVQGYPIDSNVQTTVQRTVVPDTTLIWLLIVN